MDRREAIWGETTNYERIIRKTTTVEAFKNSVKQNKSKWIYQIFMETKIIT